MRSSGTLSTLLYGSRSASTWSCKAVGRRHRTGDLLVDMDETGEPALLQHLYAQRGDYPAAIRAQRWAVWTTEFGDLPTAIARLVELQRLGGTFAEAAGDLERGVRALALLREFGPNDNYRQQRRRVIEEGFLLAGTDPDQVRARATFDLVEPIAADIALSDLALSAGLDGARHIGDADRTARWSRRIEENAEMQRKWHEFQDEEDARMERMRKQQAADD